MYKYIFSVLFLAMLLGSCGNDDKKPPISDDDVLEGGGGQTPAVTILKNAPFTVSLTNPKELATDSVQSYVLGEWNGYWLIVGGRINGFHGTGGPDRTFPVRYSNEQFIVYNQGTSQRWAAPLPTAYKAQLSSTNMPYYQDGNTLWMAGGYGCADQSNAPACYQTYPNLTAINTSGLIQAIVGGQTTGLDSFVTTLEDTRFQVTGGMINKIGNNFYLVMGQNYDTIYINGVTGKYTQEIRRYNATLADNVISISNYTAIEDPQFHRRDLNVLEAVRANGQIGINVFAGVFQPNADLGLPWPNPVLIDQDPTGNTTYKVDTAFTQQFNAYDCGHVLLFDSATKTMFTNLIGGITNAGLDASGKVIPPVGFLPFSKYVSTIAQYSNGVTVEYPQASPLLPGFIGASGDLILNPAMPIYSGSSGVIDYAKLPSGDNLVGWFYGGINSTAEQTNAVSNPSFASATIYEVHLTK